MTHHLVELLRNADLVVMRTIFGLTALGRIDQDLVKRIGGSINQLLKLEGLIIKCLCSFADVIASIDDIDELKNKKNTRIANMSEEYKALNQQKKKTNVKARSKPKYESYFAASDTDFEGMSADRNQLRQIIGKDPQNHIIT